MAVEHTVSDHRGPSHIYPSACGRGARAASWKHGRAPSVPFAQHGMRSNEIELGTRAS